MFYDVFEINAVVSKYMRCEVETLDVFVWTVVMNCHNMIKMLRRQLFQQPRRMPSDLQEEPEKA